MPFKNRDGTPMKQPPRPALATDKVRFVGDPVAFVVAETLLQAKDAAEAVEVDIEPLPAVSEPEEAARPGAPLLYDEAPGNVALDYHYGDSERWPPPSPRPRMSPASTSSTAAWWSTRWSRARRSASYDAGERRFTLHAASQGVFGMRGHMATSSRSSRSRCAS